MHHFSQVLNLFYCTLMFYAWYCLFKSHMNVDVFCGRCHFSTFKQCEEWLKRLNRAIAHPARLEELFALAYHAWCLGGNTDDEDQHLHLCRPGTHTHECFSLHDYYIWSSGFYGSNSLIQWEYGGKNSKNMQFVADSDIFRRRSM